MCAILCGNLLTSLTNVGKQKWLTNQHQTLKNFPYASVPQVEILSPLKRTLNILSSEPVAGNNLTHLYIYKSDFIFRAMSSLRTGISLTTTTTSVYIVDA